MNCPKCQQELIEKEGKLICRYCWSGCYPPEEEK